MELVNLQILTERTKISDKSFYRYRKLGLLQEGVHYFTLSYNKVLYNLDLILDWIANRQNPEAHERAIQNFLATLPSSQLPTKKAGKAARR